MSITTALKARREALADREAGFTLIELLVVVLIIGILAAIAIPVYLGVQNSAKDAAVNTDLANNKTAIIAYATANNAVIPTTTQVSSATTAASVLGTYGWSVSPNATYVKYNTGTGTTWCYLEKSASNNYFVVTSTTAPVKVTTTNPTTCTAS